MEEFIGILILLIVLPLIQRVLRGRAQRQLPPSEYEEELQPAADVLENAPGPSLETDLEQLIAEELGLKPRRSPRQRQAAAEAADTFRQERLAPPPPPTFPQRQRLPAEVDRVRSVVYPDRLPESETIPEPILRPIRAQARPEQARPRRSKRRRRGVFSLPDSANWSHIKKAIVWSEILGPPKGLSE